MKTIQEMLQELSQCIVTVSGEFRFRTNWNGGKVPQPDLDVFDPNVPFCIENVGDVPASVQYNTKNTNIRISKNYKTWNDYTSGTEIELNPTERVYIKSDYVYEYVTPKFNFTNVSGTRLRARGNIASLIYGTDDAYVNKYTSTEAYCYYYMFSGCTSLAQTPELPATKLSSGCYNSMFYGCTSLTKAPELPATTLSSGCYNSMFRGCTSLAQTPELPATTLSSDCYKSMFQGCTSLTQAPELPATKLSSNCYNSMFRGCTSLTKAPELPVTKLCCSNCYNSMFYGCTSLTKAPELPATTLSSGCYNSMFYGCTSLTKAPELPAIMTGMDSYYNMFKYCSKINYIKVLATFDSYTEGSFTDWLFGTADEGELCCYADSEYLHRFEPPIGWKITYIDPPQADHPDLDIFNPDVPFCIENTSINPTVLNLAFTGYNTTIVKHIAISYDNKRWGGWTDWYDTKKPYILKLKTKGDRVYIKAVYDTDYSSNVQLSTVSNDNMETSIRVRGNINSIIHGDTDSYKTEYTALSGYCYRRLFYGCTSLTQAPELPATTLAYHCYSDMFWNCTSLNKAPELPATTLSSDCYNSMFRGCTSLTKAPELPATTLSSDCYKSMFQGCTSLTQAPELPATNLAQSCYKSMFQGCTSLTQAPELPAATLPYNCYSSMFSNCNKLNYVKCLATNTSAEYYTNGWLSNVSATGDFYTPASTNWTTGANGIPSGWTRHDIT